MKSLSRNTTGVVFPLAIIILATSLYAPATQAQTDLPQHFTLDGRLLEPGSATEPLLDNATVMTIQVLNPAKDCILYEEEQSVNTLGTNGYFSIRVGSNTSATKRTTLDSNNSMNTVFYNRTTAISGKNSGGGACNYSPSAGEERFFRFFVKPSSASVAVQLSDDMPINSVPQAIVAQTLQGYSPTNFFRTSATSTQAKLDNLLTTEYNSITDLISGASPLYLPNDPAGTVFQSRTADPVAPTAGQVWYNSSDNRFKFYDGVSTVDVTSGAGTGTVTSVIAGAGLTGGTITTTGTISIADGGVSTVKIADEAVTTSKLDDASVSTSKLVDASVTTVKIADNNVTNAKLATGIDAAKITVGTLPAGVVPTGTDDTKLPLVGGTMTGVITMGDETNFAGFDLLNTGHITMNGQKTITIGRYDAGQEATLIGTLSPVNAGALWFNTTTGKLMFWSGTQEYEISESTSAGGDITAVNTNTGSGLSGGSTSGPVTLAINVDGTSIEIATNTLQIADGGVSTAKLADASVSTSKLVDASVTEVKLADDSVSTSKLVDASVTEVKLADGSVSTSKLVDGAVGSSKLANDAITTGKILDGTIVDADISATAGIAWSKISKIGASASDIGAVPDTRAISTNAGSGLAGGGDLSADRSLSVNVDDLTVEVNGSNALRVKDLGISTSKLADASVTEVKLADGAVSTNKLVDGAVTSAKIANGTITSIDVDTISIGKISSAVTEYFSYMPAGTECNSGEILKWDATNDRWLCDTDAVGVSSHSALTDLGADDHTQYALLAGRAGGQSFTGGTTASNNLTLDSTSNATKGFVLLQPTGGNVGVGTTNPSGMLHVERNANSSTKLIINNTTNGASASSQIELYNNNGVQGRLWTAATTYATPELTDRMTVEATNNASGLNLLSTAGAGDLRVYTGGLNERLRVNAAGNVGIGTNDPQSLLDVAGILRAQEICDESGANCKDISAGWSTGVATTRAINTHSGSGLTGGGDLSADRDLAMNVDNTTIEIATNTVQVKDVGISTAKLANTSVTEAKIAGSAVTTTKLADASVTEVKLANNSVTSAKIADGTIVSADVDNISIGKISSAPAEYFTYMPAGSECNTGEVLKWDATNDRWLCDTDLVGITDHGALTGLSDDDHTQYALLAGRAGGQSFRGGTAASNNLTLESTSDATKGHVLLQPNGGKVGIGTTNPEAALDVRSTAGGFLPPRMTTIQRDALTGVQDGTIIFNSTIQEMQYRSGTSWFSFGSGIQFRRAASTLVSDITYNGVTPTNHYVIPATLPADVRAVILRVDYHHNSSTPNTHGYLSFDAYQRGTTEADHKAKYLRTGFNDYANRSQVEILVPWRPELDDEMTIEVTSSYNSDPLNVYHIYYAGYISGGATHSGAGGGGGADDLGSHAATQNLRLDSHWLSGDGNNEGIRIDSNGNVGVGTDTPGSLLDVAGIIRAQEICDESGANCKDISTGWSTGVATSRAINTNSGSGLTGGGDLTADRDIAMNVDNTTIEIATNTVQVKDGGISTAKLANTSVTEVKLANNSVTSAKIADGTIASVDVDTISIGKISSAAAEYFTYMPAGSECNTGEVLKWNSTTDRWLCDTDAVGATDHGALTGLGDDDHTQYALLAGRTGGQNFSGGTAANNNLTLDSTSNVTKGYVIVQPSGGRVGIGTATPGEMLTVNGTIESLAGGIKFPDGTIQSTSAIGGTNNTIIAGFPDQIMCTLSGTGTMILPITQPNWSNGYTHYQMGAYWIAYSTSTGAYATHSGMAGWDCVTNAWSVSQLYAGGRAFNIAKGPASQWLAGSGSSAYYNAGNVGIGTASPGAKLDIVDGAIRTKSATTYPMFIAESATLGQTPHMIFKQSSGAGYPTSAASMGVIDSRNTNDSISARISFGADEDQSAAAAGGSITFNTTQKSTTTLTERMRIDSLGNVGIGTSAPGSALSVNGVANFGKRYENVLAVGPLSLSPSYFYIDTKMLAADGQVAPTIRIKGYLHGHNNKQVDLTIGFYRWTGTWNWAQYSAALGTYVPSRIRLGIYDDAGTSRIRIEIANDSIYWSSYFVSADDVHGAAANYQNWSYASGAFPGGTTEIVTVGAFDGVTQANNGNVGIGTSSPSSSYRLHVDATGTAAAGIFALAGTSQYGVIGRPSSAGQGGVLGYTQNATYYGILGHGNAYSFYGLGQAYSGSDSSGPGVYGYNSSNHYGVRGYSVSSYGVHGQSGAVNGIVGIPGPGHHGVVGYDNSQTTFGTLGYGSWSLYGNGSAYVAGSYSGSDRRLKDNIKNIDDGIGVILKLRPVTFDWKPNTDQSRSKKGTQYGFIAQEVKEVLPGAVKEIDAPQMPDKDGKLTLNQKLKKFLGVEYEDVIPYLTRAIQELYAKIMGHDKEIEALKAQNKMLTQRLEKLEKRAPASVSAPVGVDDIANIKSENAMLKAWACTKDPKAPFCINPAKK